MKRIGRWLRRNALNIVLGLMLATLALAAYSVVQVQTERAAAVIRDCEGQNSRHRNTIRELNREMRPLLRGASSAKRAQLEASKKFTVLLIDALAPYQNCQQVLAKSTSTRR